MIKTTGKEFKSYYTDKQAWPCGAWHDCEVVTVNGVVNDDFDVDTIADDSKITIEGGVVLGDDQAIDGPTMEEHFKAWRKRQTTVTLLVTVDRSKEAEMRALIKQYGGKVLA